MITILASLVLLQANHPDSLAARARQLADTYVVAYFERHPDEATLDGVAKGPHDRWPDNSPAALAHWQQREDAWLERLNGSKRNFLETFFGFQIHIIALDSFEPVFDYIPLGSFLALPKEIHQVAHKQ